MFDAVGDAHPSATRWYPSPHPSSTKGRKCDQPRLMKNAAKPADSSLMVCSITGAQSTVPLHNSAETRKVSAARLRPDSSSAIHLVHGVRALIKRIMMCFKGERGAAVNAAIDIPSRRVVARKVDHGASQWQDIPPNNFRENSKPPRAVYLGNDAILG